MRSHLPIGIEELLSGAVEKARLEFKATWDEKTTAHQVIKTLCAFANDLQNLNGGYVLIGIAERNGVAVRPAQGLDDGAIDAAQRWIRGNCNRIEPTYMPVFDVVGVDHRRVLVLWAPASDSRPHQAPDGPKGDRKFWIRVASETIAAKDELLTSLMQQTARVPFDDRRATHATVDQLSTSLIREFLRNVNSDLLQMTEMERIHSSMQIVAPVNGHKVPRNVALLFFSDDPERWFRGARIEVVEFLDEEGGKSLAEHVFRGPLHHQVRQCTSFLESMTTRFLEKSEVSIESRGWVSFPVPALREAVVNAVYHRSYESEVEPTKIHLYPNRIEVISYPGPVRGIKERHLNGEELPPPVPARNRRIGELLKELRLAEGRGTGLPKIRRSMKDNGSPAPRFDFDEDRGYFRVTLPAHPEYITLTLLRDYGYRKATGEPAREVLVKAWREGLRSPSLASALVRESAEQDDASAAEELLAEIDGKELPLYAGALTVLAGAYADEQNLARSKEVLDRLPSLMAARDACDAAILERRLGREDRAHRLFERAGDLVLQDVRALHEMAQSKLALTKPLARSRRPVDKQTRKRLLEDAVAALERVTQMDAPKLRHAWAWFDLGRALQWLKAPRQDVAQAFETACALNPGEVRFERKLAEVKDRS